MAAVVVTERRQRSTREQVCPYAENGMMAELEVVSATP
jgi:hypothetical protein